MSPREITYLSGEGSRIGGAAKTIGLFALIALPIGILLSSLKTKQQIDAEKAEFRRLGLDWDSRARP